MTNTLLAIPGGRYDAVALGDVMGWPVVGQASFQAMFRKLLYMMPDNTERGLVFGILDDDANPDRRLVYADFLEEQGRMEEAQAERDAAKILKMRK